jgi:hypothetical protein
MPTPGQIQERSRSPARRKDPGNDDIGIQDDAHPSGVALPADIPDRLIYRRVDCFIAI